ncbi:thiamine-phosphate pyrophosphorylase [Granulicella rosea]|uniref:Thiamine-phosphate synthase n=1 Tax=Granulicella rosea TaxID=474952 RepID=A0A239HR15_9BACT|nr:thiamine phosphate synthase [Granulicella rosea]SNS83363.1 thiamine-phosphate pyrophosphorylase [Granulicella rosea]
MPLPRLYAIVDAEVTRKRGRSIAEVAEGLRAGGVKLLQYRDKTGSDKEFLQAAETIYKRFNGSGATLLLNDRVDLVLIAGWDGVHVGQGDMPVDDVRIVVCDGRMIGVSTHTDEQVVAADKSRADYIAVGPVFATGTKTDAEPVIGLEGVRRARALTSKPLVAIGGITRENARSVIDAGADSVAVISGLFPKLTDGNSFEKVARDFLEILR